LALVLVVLAGLLTIIVVSVNGLDGDEAERECRTELRTIKAATERFKAEVGFYPPTDKALQDVDFLNLEDTPNWEVVTLDEAEGPTYRPVGPRCD